jgi:hypothetical protein
MYSTDEYLQFFNKFRTFFNENFNLDDLMTHLIYERKVRSVDSALKKYLKYKKKYLQLKNKNFNL